MKIGDLFEVKVEETIEPVIKVSETGDENKLASEISGYVVTPLIEKYLDDFFEEYTDTFLSDTGRVGVWISGYFGSGKSHLAKMIALLVENRALCGLSACDRFLARVPLGSARRGSLERSISRMGQCKTNVLPFNINAISDSSATPLPRILLQQYYLERGYVSNILYAKVIEAELDKRGKLEELHRAVEGRTGKSWDDVKRNPVFYSRQLYEATCEVAPDAFASPDDVEKGLKREEQGGSFNVEFFLETVLDDLKRKEKEEKQPQRFMLVMDEMGQWIENDAERLSKLQALVEEAAVKGHGKIWIVVTTHSDMGSVYKEARARDEDFKKIEDRFKSHQFPLTTENIELVLEERLLKKTLAGTQELDVVYNKSGGNIRGLGELSDVSWELPKCTKERFPLYYPFFPYQIHLIPEIVKSLRAKGGRPEALSGSTRTLLAISQDVLRAGRVRYIEQEVGALVSFDEFYGNLSGEGEVSPDVRADLARVKDVVPGATSLTPHIAEVLYLMRELPFITRTKKNIACLVAESVDDDLPTVLARVEPELERLIKAKLVSRIGEEYEFLTGERRDFEESVGKVETQILQQDREIGLATNFVSEPGHTHWRKWLDFDTAPYLGAEFQFRLEIDDSPVPVRQGRFAVKLYTPLAAMSKVALDILEGQSLREEEKSTVFFLSGRVKGFDLELSRFLAMKEVIENWKGDSYKSEEARKLAQERETNDLPKLENRVIEALKEGIRTGWVVFRGSSHSLAVGQGQKPSDSLRAELTTFLAQIYSKFGKVPVRVVNDQAAIVDALAGKTSNKDIQALRLFDKAGNIDAHSPLVDGIRAHLATEQSQSRRVLGQDLLGVLNAPPYGWDTNAIRVGVAALVRTGSISVLINKKPYSNPGDTDLVNALKRSKDFDKAELVLEQAEDIQEMLSETRTFLMNIAKTRRIDETPSAVSEFGGKLAENVIQSAEVVKNWATGARLPLPTEFTEGEEGWGRVLDITVPAHRLGEIHENQESLKSGYEKITLYADFHSTTGSLFIELENFVGQIRAFDYLFEAGSKLRQLLEGYNVARESASFAEKETWKTLQGLKAQAALQLQGLIEDLRIEARDNINSVAKLVPEELENRGLEPDLESDLTVSLRKIRDDLDEVTSLAKAVALKPQIEAAQKNVMERIIVAENAKKNTEPEGEAKVSPRQVHPLRVADVAAVTRVSSMEEWESLNKRLDSRVRKLISDGYDVELT